MGLPICISALNTETLSNYWATERLLMAEEHDDAERIADEAAHNMVGVDIFLKEVLTPTPEVDQLPGEGTDDSPDA